MDDLFFVAEVVAIDVHGHGVCFYEVRDAQRGRFSNTRVVYTTRCGRCCT
jgi:hypothetical protein